MTTKLVQLCGEELWFTQIDEEDLEKVSQYKWYVAKTPHTNYAWRAIKKSDGILSTQRLHTFLTGFLQTDHKNHDGLDNRRSNLREVTGSQNQFNQRARKNCSSIYKGVSWDIRAQKWKVYIAAHRKNHYGGYFDDEIEAAFAADKLRKTFHGEYAVLNFPEVQEVF